MKHKYLKVKKKKKALGKRLCIFLMVIFTLVMIVDIANLFLTPGRGQMSFGPGGGGFSMPSSGDFTMPGGGEMPGGDFQMPEGGDFQMPGGFTSGEEDGEMPSFDGEAPSFEGEMPSFGGMPGGSRGGILQTVRNLWLPILIVCALGDLICLLILIRIRRKEKALAQAFDNDTGLPPLMEEDEDTDEPPKRKRGGWFILVCLAVVFAMILSMFPTGEEAVSSADVHQELVSGTAGAGQINTVLSGAGTLEADTLTPVTVPQQVTVLRYHVRNGENVKTGDPLVSVDKTSAASAVMELNELLDELDEDLNVAKTDDKSARIASTTSGRVKKIYGWEGEKVADVLYEHGALMLLSLDGYMKVTFASEEDLSVGDTVKVQYSGGTEEGRIATVRLGKVTVTLSDKKAPYGADATVLSESGKTLGEGKLEINSEMKIIGYYGTIEQVRVNVGDKVTADNTLFALEDVGYTTEYQILLARRSELEDQLQTLSQLSRTGMVYAENDGIISGVPEDAEIELLSNSGSVKANGLSTTSGGWKVVLLANTNTMADGYYVAKITDVQSSDVAIKYYTDASINESSIPSQYEQQMNSTGVLAASLFTNRNITPVKDDYLVFLVVNNPDGSETTTILHYYSAQPSVALDGYYAAKLLDAPGATLKIKYYPTALTGNITTLTAVDLTSLESVMTASGDFQCTASNDFLLNGTSTVTLKDLQKDDLLLLTFTQGMVTNIVKAQRTADPGQSGQKPDGTQGGMPSGEMPSGGMGGMSSGGGSGFSGGMPSGMGGSVEQTYENYIVEETELLSISDQQDVSLTISLDELDILSAEVGMAAQVTLDAMKGQSFSGTIQRIGHEGTNDGGNTKFTVTITMPRQANMLDGMNASVKIVTETHDAAVTVPTAALVEEDGKTYVYTTYDLETDTLGGLTEVQTGASDGELTEILAGLNAGSTYHYRYADTVTYNFLTAI